MANMMKYALAAGAGYALHAAFKKKEESKVYNPEPLNENTLTSKIAGTVAEHISEKISAFVFDKASTPRTRHTFDWRIK